jgi:methionyl-tRNA synthetase
MPELRDTDFTREDFVARINDELLGTFGNFVNRVLTFTYRNFGGTVPAPEEPTEEDAEFLAELDRTRDLAEQHLLAFEFKASMRAVMELARAGNVYFDRQKPWELVRNDIQRCGTVLNVCMEVLSGLAVLMAPYIPLKAQEMWEMMGMPGKVDDQSWRDVRIPAEAGRPIPKPRPLIKKLDVEEVARSLGLPTMAELEAQEAEEVTAVDCPADELDMVIGRITSVEAHPDADKLWVMTVDLGPMGQRTLVAGLREHYQREELDGRRIVVVTNLAPAKLRGILSEGMLLAAEDKDGTVSLLEPVGNADPGDRLWSPVDVSDKGEVAFKRFLEMDLYVEEGDSLPAPHELASPDLVITTPDGEDRRVLHTPTAVIGLDRPVRPGSKVH